MKKSLGLFLTTLLLANTLYAQETSTIKTTIDTKQELRRKNPWSFQLDINPLFQFNGSYGVSVIYDVASNVSAEANLAQKNTTVRDYPSLATVTAKIGARSYGLRLNYFPVSTIQAGGVYTSLVASQVSLDSTITADGYYVDSPSYKKELKDEHFSRQVFVGYQFPAPKLDGRVKMTSRVGVGYGNGNKYGIEAGWDKYEIADSALFDASFLFLF